MKRFVSLILLVCMTLTLVACATDSGNNGDLENDTQDIGSDKTAYSTVRKQDYDGYEVNVTTCSAAEYGMDWEAESLNGSVVNDLIFKRNALIENDYNVTFKLHHLGREDVFSSVRNGSLSGDVHDIYGLHQKTIALAQEGLLYDLNTVEDIDLTQEWWDQNWIKTMKVQGSVYSLVGDISPYTLLSSSLLLFNKNLFDDLDLEYPYEFVKSGKWTYEEFKKYIVDYSKDLDENGVYDTEDQYGIVGVGGMAVFGSMYSCDFSFVYNKKGELVLGYNQDKLISIYSKMFDTWVTQNNYFAKSGLSGDAMFATMEETYDIFKDGRALFCTTSFKQAELYLMDMDKDFGILTMPKFDEDQKEYCSYVNPSVPTTAMAANVKNPDMIGNIIEACCALNYDTVTPELYETVAKLQRVRDLESAEILDIVFRSKVFDPSHWYMISGFEDSVWQQLTSESNGLVSELSRYTSSALKEVEYINTQYRKLAQQNES